MVLTTIADIVDFPSLETERLVLRQLTSEDIDFVFRHFSDPAVTQYLMDEPPLGEYAQAQEIVQFYLELEGKTHNRWVIIRKSDCQPIGTCGYHKWAKQCFRTEIGYDLGPLCWGQGYMMEALRTVIRHGFGQMGLNRSDALVCVGNHRSVRLLQKLGFEQEGLLRNYFYLDGESYSHYLFALLRRDWHA